MAYRLKRQKPVARELSRIVAKEFEGAREELSGDSSVNTDEAVHEARKHVKKIRAVLRLLQGDLGKDYRVQNQRLRDVAHELSPLRDVDASAEIVKALGDHYPRVVTPKISAPVYRGFSRRKRAAVARLHPERVLPRAAHALDQSAGETPQEIRRVARVAAAMKTGVIRGYRRARKAMAGVRAHPEDTQFHTWRRRVKDHAYHLQLLEGLSGRAHNRAQRLKQLETWLGDDHNLVVARATILDAPAHFGNARATAVVLGCVAKYQATLRRRALKLGGRLFGTDDHTFGQSIGRWLRMRS
jgi:CHAD domain-containing protein